MLTFSETQAAAALKSIARNQEIKTYLQQSPELYPILLKAAKRFVTGDKREDGLNTASRLTAHGYHISLEYIGENTRTREECVEAKDEFLALIEDLGDRGLQSTVSLDLSHIGLMVDSTLAFDQLSQLALEAERRQLSIIVSMEESAKRSQILEIYREVSKAYPNVGVTIQAQLKRTATDLKELLKYAGKIRVVKGAYQESDEIAFSRGVELNQRYLQLVQTLVESGHPTSIATHDQLLLEEIEQRGYLQKPHLEVEMLYGVRPDLLRHLKDVGITVQIYLTYGVEWYLYLCHRLAEYPPNLYIALADCVKADRSENGPDAGGYY